MRASHGTEGTQPGSLHMAVTVGAEYADEVHDGTRRMPPRPWLRETTEQTFPKTIAELKQVERAL
jgi:HK97 gp10 family phage protein